MRVALNKGLSVLLGLLLALILGWQSGSAVASQDSPLAAPTCHCCNADRSNCATPACCARPADGRAPATPVVPRCASGSQWHAIAPPSLPLLTLARSTLPSVPLAPPPVQAEAVPIFQRDCSFLL
jgi:hypothetical protein